jgi:hypothetical protein
MERLGTVVARVLQDTRRAMDERKVAGAADAGRRPGRSLRREEIAQGEERRHGVSPKTTAKTAATQTTAQISADA